MTKPGAPEPDPSAISVIPKPPFARLPEPRALFTRRAARFNALAEGHDLAPYLRFLAEIAGLQAKVQEGLPPPGMPEAGQIERASRHAMPPLDRGGFVPGPETGVLIDRLMAAAQRIDMPPAARAALNQVAAAGDAERRGMIDNVLADAIPFEAVAEHVLLAAVLQVDFARRAACLHVRDLKPVGDGVCPACGGPPSASVVVAWARAEGARFCACSLCGTLWNYVRAKCTLCGSTGAISFRSIAGGDGNVKAEICGSCRGYVKVLYQQQYPALDPVADDVATLGLDLLVRDLGFRRGAVNPFLVGY